MKKIFFLGLMLLTASTTFAARYYVMGDDRAIPMSANTSIMEKTELMLWIRDWGDLAYLHAGVQCGCGSFRLHLFNLYVPF